MRRRILFEAKSKLPIDYKEVEYINNTGNRAVDLGFKFRLLDYSIESKFKQDTISNGMVCGTSSKNNGAIWFYCYTTAGHNVFNVYACAVNDVWKIDIYCFKPDKNIHVVKYEGSSSSQKVYCDDVLKTNKNLSSYTPSESSENLFLFGRGSSSNPYIGRIYYTLKYGIHLMRQ